MSPVRSHLPHIASPVASGLFQYPVVTPGPFTSSSPGSPRLTFLPLSSATLALTGGSATPTHPGGQVSQRNAGFSAASPVSSTMPYASAKSGFFLRIRPGRAPSSRILSMCSWGIASALDPSSRRDVRSYFSGSLASRKAYMVGTPTKRVAWCSSISFSAFFGSKCLMM